MTRAALVVALANAHAARRPPHARRAYVRDALRDPESAAELVAPFVNPPLDARDVAELRALQGAVAPIVHALIDGSPAPLEALNALAERAPAVHALERGADGELRQVVRPAPPSPAGTLLLEVVRELGELEPSRLRRCARPECDLVFYDASRSATQRWHAERPCGLRERQRRHRAGRP